MILDLNQILDFAEDALDQGQPEIALEYCDQILQSEPSHAGALFLTAEALRDLGNLPEAERRYQLVAQLNPQHSPSWSALGAVQFDQLQFQSARTHILRAIRLDPTNPEAYYWRGMLRERRGDTRGADRDFRRASQLDPSAFPQPVRLDDSTIEAVVEEVLRSLHSSIRAALVQVPILLEETPDTEICKAFDPPAPPGEILGYFSGSSISERELGLAWTALPSAIVLFRRNLERIAWDHERLVEELRVTLYHEVGHYLGLSEDDLHERGLD